MKSFVVFCVLLIIGVKASPSPFISNGADSLVNVPSYVHITYLNEANLGFFGGGHIITNSHVLTAAHLVHNFVIWHVEMGSANLDQLLTITSTNAVSHPDFNPTTLQNDIAIITFQVPIMFTATVQPIRLPTATSLLPMENEQGVVYGFGFLDLAGTTPNRLQMAYKRVVSNTVCIAAHSQLVMPNHFCITDEVDNANICWGDTGGGFIVSDRGEQFLVGIASVAPGGCESTQPSAFTRISTYRAWIQGITTV